MSRIGKIPVEIPDKVNVTLDNDIIAAKGPLGELSLKIRPEIAVAIEGNKVVLTRKDDESKTRALHGLTRSLVYNLVTGVSTGFTKRLEIHGVGYRASKDGRKLVLQLGYSHPVELEPPEGIEVTLEGNTKISITGADKQMVGDFAADIRSKRPPEVYKAKGIRYAGEVIRKKAGKTGK